MNNKIFTDSTEEKLFQTLREFKAYISTYCEGAPFDSFKDNDFINNNENYKKLIWEKNKSIKKQIKSLNNYGSGQILDLVIKMIEVENNNLVEWHGKKGPDSKEHSALLNLKKGTNEQIREFEENTSNFFKSAGITDEEYFNYFVNTINHKYPLIAYLFYLKDRKQYLPIKPTFFDKFFKEHSIDLVTAWHCSWENYCEYIEVFKLLKSFLRENLDDDACLVDAHSFAWIMVSQYKADLSEGLYTVPESIKLKEKNKEVIVKARIGQGLYRDKLIKKWDGTSSISNYSNTVFLIASHIKPWSDCNNEECIDVENGLLLKPDYDALFDKGYITFEDDGSIRISKILTEEDIQELRITPDIKI